MVSCFKVGCTTRTAVPVELKPNQNFIVIWFSVKFPRLRACPISGRPKNIAGINIGIHIACGYGFGGYCDWTHLDFDAKISIRQDHAHDYEIFDVGTYGLCISCANEISSKLLCQDCDHDGCEFCRECENYCSETWEVINRHGERINVCESCLDEYYRLCEHCQEYHDRSRMTLINDGSYVCSRCLADEYLLCNECDEYFLADEVSLAIDADGNNVYVCDHCRDKHYTLCSECERFFHNDSVVDELCPNCRAEEVPA